MGEGEVDPASFVESRRRYIVVQGFRHGRVHVVGGDDCGGNFVHVFVRGAGVDGKFIEDGAAFAAASNYRFEHGGGIDLCGIDQHEHGQRRAGGRGSGGDV